MNRSGIEWTDYTWNPVTGCTKVSPGCAHCYAEAATLRFKRGPAFLPNVTDVQYHAERLAEPYSVVKPSRVFVCSMSDLFHEAVSDDQIGRVFLTMLGAFHHTYQVLTKRPERMRDIIDQLQFRPHDNIWLGVSVENKAWKHRIDVLRECPATVRFLSVEPLLGPVGDLDLAGISWVIVGGESGRRARPMALDWARDVRDQCVDAGVAFFFKQQGARSGHGIGTLDGVRWNEHPCPNSGEGRGGLHCDHWRDGDGACCGCGAEPCGMCPTCGASDCPGARDGGTCDG